MARIRSDSTRSTATQMILSASHGVSKVEREGFVAKQPGSYGITCLVIVAGRRRTGVPAAAPAVWLVPRLSALFRDVPAALCVSSIVGGVMPFPPEPLSYAGIKLTNWSMARAADF
jgi:hypothetical protein